MVDTLEVIKRLESLVFKLTKSYESLKKDLSQSEDDKSKLKQDNILLNKKIENLTTENEQLKTANAILGSKDYKRETKLKINRLIREVDSCIVQLSE